MQGKISDIYGAGGNLLSAKIVKDEKLAGKKFVVKSADVEMLGEKEKVILSFNEIERRLALNATNAGILADQWGEEFDSWVGKTVMLIITKTKYKGELVDSIQVVPQ